MHNNVRNGENTLLLIINGREKPSPFRCGKQRNNGHDGFMRYVRNTRTFHKICHDNGSMWQGKSKAKEREEQTDIPSRKESVRPST